MDDAGSDGFSAVDISGAQLKPYRLGMGIMVMARPGPRCLRVDVSLFHVDL